MVMNVPRIETERYVLQLITPEYASALLEYYLRNRKHLEPWEPERGESYYTLPTMKIQAQQSLDDFRSGSALRFLALDKNTEHPIATCYFSNIVQGVFQACHIGYTVDAQHEGQGVMREVVEAGIDYMFTKVGLHRIMANYLPRNVRSQRLLESLGFEKEGLARDYLKICGQWEDHVLTSLIRPESINKE